MTEIHIVNGLCVEFTIFTIKSASIVSWSAKKKNVQSAKHLHANKFFTYTHMYFIAFPQRD